LIEGFGLIKSTHDETECILPCQFSEFGHHLGGNSLVGVHTQTREGRPHSLGIRLWDCYCGCVRNVDGGGVLSVL